MSEPIFNHLKDEAHDLLERAEHPFRHHHDLPSQPSPTQPVQPQEVTMTTPAPADTTPKTGLAAEIDAKLEEAATNIGAWFDDARTDLKTRLGPVVDKAVKFEQQVEGDKFIGDYLAANFSVPEHLVSLGLDFLQKLVSASASSPETPAGIDAQADAAPSTPPVPATA